jgi:heme-degrading monooxygenase HmoA
MVNITIGKGITTLVTVYEVDAALQQQLVDLLTAAYDQLFARQPGFISAHVLRGLEGTRVAGYTQWESRAAADAVLRSDELWHTFLQLQRIAVADPWFYEVAYVAAPGHPSSGAGSAP